ncbi:MAG: hypothetical protein K0041_06425 [Acidithiobacillus sp.]|nr:hypothetical protein [Acidithiobacillus sp.]
MTEVVVVAGFVLVPLLLLGVYVGKWAYVQNRSIEAARYAAWERVVSPASPPQGRSWSSLKSDTDLQHEVAIRFFGARGERLTAVTGSADAGTLASGSSREPLLRKHDGEILLVERENNITVSTREEGLDPGLLGGLNNALNRLTNNPLASTGPTVATVSTTVAGLPQRIFAEVGLGNPLQFTAQAAVLTDPWTANGPQESEAIQRNGFLKYLDTVSKGKIPFNYSSQALYYEGLLLGNLFSEYQKHWNDPDRDQMKIDVEQQYGDRLQPMPRIPDYTGP